MIIARVQGGLGNQLFIYAALRGIASRHGLEPAYDVVSAAATDNFGRGHSLLHHFAADVREADPSRCFLGTLGRLRRKVVRRSQRLLPFGWRTYIEEPPARVEERLLAAPPRDGAYLEGYWQSERYFGHIRAELLEELRIVTPHDAANRALAEEIRSRDAVCLHARRLHGVGAVASPRPAASVPSLPVDYYRRALALAVEGLSDPTVYCFSDYPDWIRSNLEIPFRTVHVTHNTVDGETKNYEDLWLMSQCRRFVLANSSFSWWGAWLSTAAGKRVIVPSCVRHLNEDWVAEGWTEIPGELVLPAEEELR